MLHNYLKISIAVLLRRKFLTFVNLFGSALTLTVLIVAYSAFDSIVSPAGAQHRQDQILTIDRLRRLESRSPRLTTCVAPDQASTTSGVGPSSACFSAANGEGTGWRSAAGRW